MTISGKWAGLFILLVAQIWMNDLQTNNKQHQAATYQNYAQHPRRHNFELRNRTKVRTSESSTMTFRSNKHQLSLLTTLGWRQLPKVAGGFWKYEIEQDLKKKRRKSLNKEICWSLSITVCKLTPSTLFSQFQPRYWRRRVIHRCNRTAFQTASRFLTSRQRQLIGVLQTEGCAYRQCFSVWGRIKRHLSSP